MTPPAISSGGKSAPRNRLAQAWRRTLRRCGPERAVLEAASGRASTFQELEAGADAWLAAQGVDVSEMAGRPVVVAEPNGIRWLEIFIGLLRTGAVIVPLDAAEPAAAQRRTAEALRAAFWWNGGRLVALPRARRFRSEGTCLIKLTSGTTGRPRPLVFSDDQMLADGRQVVTSMGIRRDDLNYGLIPLGHSYGLGNLTIPLIANGIPLVCGAAPLPQAIAEDFIRWRPTVFPSVPPVIRALVDSGVAGDALASVRLAISAGAPLAPDVARAFAQRFGRPVHAFYGSSETGGIAFDRTGRATLEGGVGRAMRGVEIRALAGARIEVCSAAVFTHGNRRASRGGGCWLPPDRAMVDQEGRITLLGRRGTTVKIAGRRINLAEVVARLRRIPGVRDAWAAAGPGAEPVLGAAVATARTAAELRHELMADTAAWKIPKRWAVLPEFPQTARGKLDTRALSAAVFR